MSADAEPTDAELVARVRSGAIDAYAAIVRRHQRAIWRVLVAILGDDPATENLVQQCFVDAYEHLSQFRESADLERWLKGIARNLARMELRRAGREAERLRRYRTTLLAELDAEDAADAVDRAARDEVERRMREALARCRQELVPAASRALELRYQSGHGLEQVAAALGRTVAATRQLLFRARIALRDCVEARLVRA